MAETLYTIQEASELVGKSVQTIRRALKSKKLEAKRKKTPQGFNYLIKAESLEQLYNLHNLSREHQGLKSEQNGQSSPAQSFPAPSHSLDQVSTEKFATKADLEDQKKQLSDLIAENRKDKDTFMRFVKVFQDRFTALENQVKLLEEPLNNKKWYQFWK